jgi:DNA-binding MurR/RpiR family transcriptional regulator
MDIREIIAELGRLRSEMSPQVKRAAEFVLRNPALIAMHSMRRVAKEAGVTPPTMLRMVKIIRFDSYGHSMTFIVAAATCSSAILAGGRKLQMRHDRVSLVNPLKPTMHTCSS